MLDYEVYPLLTTRIEKFLIEYLNGHTLVHTDSVYNLASSQLQTGDFFYTIEDIIKNPDPASYQVYCSLFVPYNDVFNRAGSTKPFSLRIPNREPKMTRIVAGNHVFLHLIFSKRLNLAETDDLHTKTIVNFNGKERIIGEINA